MNLETTLSHKRKNTRRRGNKQNKRQGKKKRLKTESKEGKTANVEKRESHEGEHLKRYKDRKENSMVKKKGRDSRKTDERMEECALGRK